MMGNSTAHHSQNPKNITITDGRVISYKTTIKKKDHRLLTDSALFIFLATGSDIRGRNDEQGRGFQCVK